MTNGKSGSVGSDIGLGFLALVASVGVQDLGPFQYILELYPENLRMAMEPLSALVVGATVSVTLFLFTDKSVETVKALVKRAFMLIIAAILAFVVLTLLFVIEIYDNVDQRSYPVIVGIAGHPMPQCDSAEPCDSQDECLRYWGVDRNGSMRCSGRPRVIIAETLIITAYLAIALVLGGLGALLRIASVAPTPAAPTPAAPTPAAPTPAAPTPAAPTQVPPRDPRRTAHPERQGPNGPA